jgi:two-component system phosphate regulon response regulator PhoB
MYCQLDDSVIAPSVLVVEDEAAIREMVSYNLSREGYRVAGVQSGEDALALAQIRPFDLIILDRLLPGVDGLEVCRRLRNDPKTRSVGIILVTALGEETDVVAGFHEGADDYITKPFSPKVMSARVQAVLRRKHEED